MIVIDIDKEDDIVLMSTKNRWRMHMRDARVAEFECNENVESLGGWKHASLKIQAGDIIHQKFEDTSKDTKVPKFFEENDNPFITFSDIKAAISRSNSKSEEDVVYLKPLNGNDKRLVYMPDEMLPPKFIGLKGEVEVNLS